MITMDTKFETNFRLLCQTYYSCQIIGKHPFLNIDILYQMHSEPSTKKLETAVTEPAPPMIGQNPPYEAGLQDQEMSTLWCVILVLLVAVGYVAGQINTNPPAENFGSAVVAALENASNVTVFCAVTFRDGGSARTSAWFITLKNSTRERILFDEPNFETVYLQSNFTILSFSAELDMAILECTNSLIPPNTQTVFFTLRTLG